MLRSAVKMHVLVSVAVLLVGCGEDFAISGQTVGLVRLVRPGVEISREGSKRTVLEDTRLIDGTHVVADGTGRAILDLDNGARVVVDAQSDVALQGMDVLSSMATKGSISRSSMERSRLPGGTSLL